MRKACIRAFWVAVILILAFLVSSVVCDGIMPFPASESFSLDSQRDYAVFNDSEIETLLKHAHSRKLSAIDKSTCRASSTGVPNAHHERYFDAIDHIYEGFDTRSTCLPHHKSCGWPVSPAVNEFGKKLPLFVLSVGLEGAGHHLWTELLGKPVFDCVWTNARHYFRDIADGVPRTTAMELYKGFQDHFKLRSEIGKPPCVTIYDSEDSFPTGAMRKNGRLMMRPDIVNLQQLDGVVFDIKYLIILRNTTDTALSALRRNFFTDVELELRTIEHTLTYLEAALRGIPCERMFVAHYEHVLADPQAYIEPLSEFLELKGKPKEELRRRFSKKGKTPGRKAHKLTQYRHCKTPDMLSVEDCYAKISGIIEEFLSRRSFMWPTFAGNGFLYQTPKKDI